MDEDDCRNQGHDFHIERAVGRLGPDRVFCPRCDAVWRVHPDDRRMDLGHIAPPVGDTAPNAEPRLQLLPPGVETALHFRAEPRGHRLYTPDGWLEVHVSHQEPKNVNLYARAERHDSRDA